MHAHSTRTRMYIYVCTGKARVRSHQLCTVCTNRSLFQSRTVNLCENIRPYMAGLQVIVINIRSRLGVFLDVLLRGDDKAHKAAARGSDISNSVLF